MDALTTRFRNVISPMDRDFPDWRDVEAFLTIVQPSVTFFGSRVVTHHPIAADGIPIEGSISLTELSKEVYQAAMACYFADALSLEQRVAGISCLHKLQEFYTATDVALEDVSLLTNFFGSLGEVFSDFELGIYLTNHVTSIFFHGFTVEKYRETFGEDPSPTQTARVITPEEMGPGLPISHYNLLFVSEEEMISQLDLLNAMRASALRIEVAGDLDVGAPRGADEDPITEVEELTTG